MSLVRRILRKCLGQQGIDPTATISFSAEVDRSCRIESHVNVAARAELSNNTVVGVRTSIGRDSKLSAACIGNYCSISWNVTIGAPAHLMDHLTMHAFPYRSLFGLVEGNRDIPRPDETVRVGHDVWIGCGAIILSGVHVGSGAVVGAGAVVTKDVPPYGVVAGVPARIIRYRFADDVSRRLLKTHWWDWPDCTMRTALNDGLFDRAVDAALMDRLESLRH